MQFSAKNWKIIALLGVGAPPGENPGSATGMNSVHVDDWTAERMIIASSVNSVHEDDWTAERVIIASNVNSVHVDDWTAERAIIANNVNSVWLFSTDVP